MGMRIAHNILTGLLLKLSTSREKQRQQLSTERLSCREEGSDYIQQQKFPRIIFSIAFRCLIDGINCAHTYLYM